MIKVKIRLLITKYLFKALKYMGVYLHIQPYVFFKKGYIKNIGFYVMNGNNHKFNLTISLVTDKTFFTVFLLLNVNINNI